MNKLIILILTFSIFFIHKNFDNQYNLSKNDTIIKLKKIITEKNNNISNLKIEEFDDKGNLIKKYDSTENTVKIKKYSYDLNNNCIEEFEYINGDEKKSISRIYDIDNNLLEEIENKIITKYKYNSENKLLKIEYYDENSILTSTSNYYYKLSDNSYYVSSTNSNSSMICNFEYNYKDKLISKSMVNKFKENNYTFYKYDSKGNLIKEKSYFPSLNDWMEEIIKTYDENNNMIIRESKFNEMRGYKDTITSFGYTNYNYENNKLTSDFGYSYDWNFIDTIFSSSTYKYDIFDNLILQNTKTYGGLLKDTLNIKISYYYEYY